MMPILRSSALLAFLSAILCIFILGAYALGELQFQPVNPGELKMTSEPLAPGAPAIVLFREVNRNDYGRNGHGGAQVSAYNSIERLEEHYTRIKILTAEGRKFADVEIPIVGEHGVSITGINARTIRPDGSIVNFDGKVFDKTVYKRKGLKYQAKTFTLSDVQVGSVIEYYYTINFAGGWLFHTMWDVSDELFQREAKFSLIPFQAGYTQVFMRRSEHLPPGMPGPTVGPDGTVRLDVHNVPAFQAEDFMPPENEYRSRVDFIYSAESPEADVNKFWQKIGKKRNGELESFAGKPAAAAPAASLIISSADSPEAKLQKLYAKVQQLRNTSYEVQKTEEEKKHENEKDLANANEVLKRGYGTADQLNWVYLDLLRAAGFEAYGVAVSDRSTTLFNPQRMNAHELDQTAVLVKVNGKDLYLDPGAAFAPFGFLKWEETGVQGLRLDRNGGTWIQTAVPDSSLSQVQRKGDLKLSENGDLEGKLSVTYTGLEGLRRRVEERNEDEVARKKYLEDEVKQYLVTAAEVKLLNTPEWSNSSVPLVAEFSIKIPGWMVRGGQMAFASIGMFGAPEKHLFDHSERVYPIYFDFPSQKVDDIAIDLPAGWRVSGFPQAQNFDYHVVAYSVAAENNNGKLHLHRKLEVNIVSLDPKYYGPLRSFFQGVKSGDDERVVLQMGTERSSR
ncbi:MAG: DUF3857 domain-containing protein [Terriglobales bacterium]